MIITQSYLNVLMSWRLWRKIDSLGDEHPVNKALDAAFAREYSAIRAIHEPSYCGRYLVRKDRHKAWGSPEHLSREMPW